MNEDHQLLQRYVRERSDSAFAALVDRYIDMVWATARRVAANDELARDVSQSVFIDLAAKAERITPNVAISAWLYKAAVYAARKAVRSEARRSRREQRAMELQSQAPAGALSPEASALEAKLDAALADLPEKDRAAVVMRFLARKTHSEIGAELGVSEDAAQKRVSRALDRMRVALQRAGAPSTLAGLTAALTHASSQAAPPGLALAVASSSVAASGAAGGLAAAWTTIKLETLAMKSQLALGACVVAGLTTPIALQQKALADLRAEQKRLEQSADDLPALEKERQRRDQWERARARQAREDDELAALTTEIERLRASDLASKRVLAAELEAAQSEFEDASARAERTQIEADMRQHRVHVIYAMKNMGLAARIWATENNDRLPTDFVSLTNELGGAFTYDPASKKIVGEYKGGITLDAFEWVPHARTISEKEPNLALFREKEPRQWPDGHWERVYTLVDGSVQTLSSDTRDFSHHDKKMTASDPEIPAQFADDPAYQ